MRQKRLWTANEITHAQAMLAAGTKYRDVDRALDRYIGATWQKLHRTRRHTFRKLRSVPNHMGGARYVRPSAEQLADRDRRNVALDRRTQTQEFCGDPAPGFSALDRANEARLRAIFLPPCLPQRNGDR